jgi:hypothetical protein
MQQQNRRVAMGSMAGLWLTACGGGGAGEEEAVAVQQPTGGAVAAPTGSEPAAEPAATSAAPANTPQSSALPAAVAAGGDARQFLTWDAGSGPARDFWSRHLKLRWRNPSVGDWIDANDIPQGPAPFVAAPVTTGPGWQQFDGTVLVNRWLRAGENKGFMLRISGKSSPSLTWAGRLSGKAPRLVVTLLDGRVVECPCHAFAGFAASSTSGLDTRQQTRTSTVQSSILQFDQRALSGAVRSAVVHLHCDGQSGTALALHVFECDPPRFQLGADHATPLAGLAAEVGNEAALKSHPDVIRAGDFSNLSKGALFDSLELSENSVNQQLPDPDRPGSVMFRGSFTPLGRGSFSGHIETMRANYNDPLRPPAAVEEEMFARLYFFLEDDWRSTRDANKMAIGWDLRMGWWNNAQGGYWQSTTGNGGARGSGLKIYASARRNGSSQSYDCWEYQGHSIRMEAGLGVDDGNPYESLRPVESYVYNLDQATAYGDMYRLGNAVIQRGRWHCIEQQIKMNSVTGPFDAVGNGQAVADGEMRSWLDGVLVSEVKGLRWRRHPEMGIQGPWLNWYYGGKQPTERTMHYRMNHLVVARRYIGPRAA